MNRWQERAAENERCSEAAVISNATHALAKHDHERQGLLFCGEVRLEKDSQAKAFGPIGADGKSDVVMACTQIDS
ncbi:hypothetical protein NM688_g6097 [Phlebia brevispora]|uniref:Uncharacterized protein n=1 Tax=Phlebia brevispora TaxID=194682 RepID=A0ACC1SK42_9APHY|nr:hypothetical protein NM688_g6097 [Phlebia brevispora]